MTILESIRNRCNAGNTSGRTGVYFNPKTGRWNARITFKRKTCHPGSYAGRQEAIRAREQGEEMHEDFLEWYYANHPIKQEETLDRAGPAAARCGAGPEQSGLWHGPGKKAK